MYPRLGGRLARSVIGSSSPCPHRHGLLRSASTHHCRKQREAAPLSGCRCTLSRSLSTCCSRAAQGKEVWALPDRDNVIRRPEGGHVILDIEKVRKEPFIKGLFQGRFDTEMLAFPEVLNKQQVDELEHKLVALGLADDAAAPDLETLRTGGVFGLDVPDQYGGLSYTVTEAARVLEAAASTPHHATLQMHYALVQALVKCGSAEQRERLLPALARGEQTATFCCAERAASSDLSQLRSVAASDGQRYRLSGEKVGVVGARHADLMLVFANIMEKDHLGNLGPRLSACVVERESEGITMKPCQPDPTSGLDVCDVEFDNTPVAVENVIGEPGSGQAVLLEVLSHLRTLYPAQLVGRLRPLVAMTTQHCLNRPAFDKFLSDFGHTRSTLALVNRDLYTMESLTYLTAGVVDLTLEPDYVLEAICCKVVASELAQTVVDRCLRLLGDRGCHRRQEAGDTAYRYLWETRAALRFTGSNELLRMFIALGGLHDAVSVYAEEVTKMRNPMSYPLYVLQRAFSRTTRWGRDTRQKLNLFASLHPTLEPAAQQLEGAAGAFADSCGAALELHGADVMNRQPELLRLADSACRLYCSVAVLARASRSYCIGLRDADAELSLATSVAAEATERVQHNCRRIADSPHQTPEALLERAADVVLERGGYHSQHSLTRSY